MRIIVSVTVFGYLEDNICSTHTFAALNDVGQHRWQTRVACSTEEENYVRMSLLLTGISPRGVRVLFDREFAPTCLDGSIKKEYKKLKELQLKHIINQSQWNLLFPRYPVQHAIGLNLLRRHSHIANHHVNRINHVANKHVARISHVSNKHERNIAYQAGKHVHKIASVANKHINRFKALVDFHINRLHKRTKQHLSALEYQHKRHLHDREFQNKKHELKVDYLHGKHEHTINKLHDYHGIYGVGHLVSYLDYYKKYHGFKISHNRFSYGGKDYDAGYSPKTVVVKTASYGDDSLY
ncbi:Hypothetical predicted protein [Mytilus galloprovincialis]|uniref:Uncharacterized protein n=1 Tax=Mytilus galloprovincialis TaxID=29158 RepID=A0A8B6BE60_MYTGA|nr:Hypothetical predicted protein [Mytilus galloprovincialis]